MHKKTTEKSGLNVGRTFRRGSLNGIPRLAAALLTIVGLLPDASAQPLPPVTSDHPATWRLIGPRAKTAEKIQIISGNSYLSPVPGRKLVVVDAQLEHSGQGVLTLPVEEVVMTLGENSGASASLVVAGIGLVDNETCQIAQGLQGIASGGVKTSLSRTGESLELARANTQAALKMTIGGSPTHLCFVFAVPQEYQGRVGLRVADAVTEPLELATVAPSTTAGPAPSPQLAAQPMPAQPFVLSDRGAAVHRPTRPEAKPRVRKNFFESIFAARLELGAGGPLDGVVAEEEKMGVTATYSDGSSETQHPTHVGFHVSPNLEIAVVRIPKFKLALRLGYHFDAVEQDLSVGGGQKESKSWSGTLLSSDSVLMGPVFYINFGKGWFGSFEGLGGPMSGTLHPLAATKQVDGTQVPDVGFGGWRLLLGPGFGYAFGTLLVGGDLTYGLASMNLDQLVYTSLGKQSSYSQIGFNGYIGVHL